MLDLLMKGWNLNTGRQLPHDAMATKPDIYPGDSDIVICKESLRTNPLTIKSRSFN